MFRQPKRNRPRRHGAARSRGGQQITMLLENNPYPQDVRVRSEAQSLVAAGHSVEVIAPRLKGQPAKESVDGVVVRRYRATGATGRGLAALLLEYSVAMVALHAGAIRALARGVTVLRNGRPASWTRLPLSIRPGRLSPVRLAYVGAIAQQDGVEALADILVLLRDRTPSVAALR